MSSSWCLSAVLVLCSLPRYFLLLLCCDVSVNPGPVRYPCTVCSKCVRSNQRALQCDMCQLWSHLTCVGVDRDFYAELQEKSEFSWQCPSCLFSVLPSNDIIEADFWLSPSPCDLVPLMDDVLESPLSGIRIIHHNIQGLLSKLDSLAAWFNTCSGENVVF